MSWRTVVIANSAKLDYHLGFMAIRSKETVRIHIEEINILMIKTTAVSLTAALISELTRHKVKVIFCDEHRNPCLELIPYYGSYDISVKVKKQIEWSKNDKDLVWTSIISNKIEKQADFLLSLNKPEAALLYKYKNEIKIGDTTNREGHAAKVYFNALFGKKFSRSDTNSINAALNYGYSLILSAVNREIAVNGYITQIGLFHDNMFNQFNLGSDMMEPFRPLIDQLVVSLDPQEFGKDEKYDILHVFDLDLKINGKKESITNAIRIYCRSIFDALNSNDISLIRFYDYEF